MLTVKDYHGNVYLAHIEEPLERVNWIIKFEDHGDTFFIVSIEDKLYAYGWWEDRYEFHQCIRPAELCAEHSAQEGAIGIAAKEDWSALPVFECDCILSIWHEGEWHDTAFLSDFHAWDSGNVYRGIEPSCVDYDDYGFSTFTYEFAAISNELHQNVLF